MLSPLLCRFPRRGLAVFLLACVVRLGAADPASAPRWNILFVFADDWGRYASAYAAIDGKPSLNDIVKRHGAVIQRNRRALPDAGWEYTYRYRGE